MGMLNKLPSFRPFQDKLELAEDFKIRIDNQLILIPKGFKFDGASIPNFVWAILDLKPTDSQMLVPSLVHDFLFTYKLFSREKWKVTAMYQAVRIFGGGHWE